MKTCCDIKDTVFQFHMSGGHKAKIILPTELKNGTPFISLNLHNSSFGVVHLGIFMD